MTVYRVERLPADNTKHLAARINEICSDDGSGSGRPLYRLVAVQEWTGPSQKRWATCYFEATR